MWRRRLLALLGIAAAGALGLLLWLQLSADGSSPAPRAQARDRAGAAAPVAPRAPAGPGRARIEKALTRAVEAAAALGGTVEAAAIEDRWSTPLVKTSEPGGGARYMRMWSMSKVATMIALLRSLGWGARPGKPTSAEVDEAFSGAIRRSENCRQRRVVLELERVSGGTAEARAALADVFLLGGAHATIGSETEAAESSCAPYLEAQAGVSDPMRPALLLGISTWRVGDAALLVHALATDRFGAAVSDRVLGLMREPKLVSREVPPGELTAPLDWGAGEVFAGQEPAYKAGWGGAMNGDFLAGQVAVVALPGGERMALAAMFHPEVQPSRDDPGITAAPQAIELVMRSLREAAE